jgi:ABC-type uncharacterized transport system ATPase subunit
VTRVDGVRQWLRLRQGTSASAATVVSAVMAEVEVVDIAVEEPAIDEVVTAVYERAARTDARSEPPVDGA